MRKKPELSAALGYAEAHINRRADLRDRAGRLGPRGAALHRRPRPAARGDGQDLPLGLDGGGAERRGPAHHPHADLRRLAPDQGQHLPDEYPRCTVPGADGAGDRYAIGPAPDRRGPDHRQRHLVPEGEGFGENHNGHEHLQRRVQVLHQALQLLIMLLKFQNHRVLSVRLAR